MIEYYNTGSTKYI